MSSGGKNFADIFTGVTPAPVRSFFAELMQDHDPPRVVHPCVGRFGALTAAVKVGIPPERHEASDLGLYSSVIGHLADPSKSLLDLKLKPTEEVGGLFADADLGDEMDFAARIMLGMKYVQLAPVNRYMEGLRRELRLRYKDHIESLRNSLQQSLDVIGGLKYEARNLWDVLADLEATPPEKGSVLYMSMPWYENDFTKQMAAAERAFGWPGLIGREFSPADLHELLSRANDTGMTVYAHCGSAVADKVPENYTPVMAYEAGEGKIDRLYTNDDPGKRYAPNPIPRMKYRQVPLWDEADLTPESKCEIVPVDEDTAVYVRDLFVHRLGTSRAEGYYALTLDEKLVVIYGLVFNHVYGGGDWIMEQFGISITSEKYPRFNRLSPLVLTAGETKGMLQATNRPLQVRDPKGIQSSDFRFYNDSKVKRGPFKPYYTEQLPNGLWKIVTRGPFREGETWQDAYTQWWNKWTPEAIERRGQEEARRKEKKGKRGRTAARTE